MVNPLLGKGFTISALLKADTRHSLSECAFIHLVVFSAGEVPLAVAG